MTILTEAAEAFLLARTEGNDPVQALLDTVPEAQLQAAVDSAKRLLRPEDLDSLDLIESRYVPMRQSLLSLYQALDFQPFRRSEPALQALEHVSTLAKQRRRVTAKEQKVGKVKVHAPLGHLTGRWRKHALEGEKITPNYYEAAAFEALKGRLRSGDIAVSGSRRYRPFEHYLLPSAHFEQLAEKQQTRLAVNSDAEVYLTTKQRMVPQCKTACALRDHSAFLFLHQLISQRLIQCQVDGRPSHRQCAIKHRFIGLWRDTGGGKFQLVVSGG